MTAPLSDTTATKPTSPLSQRVVLWALAIIFLANLFNYMDRMIVSAMEKQLSLAFQLNSREYGYLWSLFTIGYLLCATPIGYLADRYNRPLLFAVCIVIWSAATIGSGMAGSKPILYVSRLLIGVGEAGCLIIGPALLSDYFTLGTRGRALSVFYLGQPLGGTAGLVLPSIVINLGHDWPLAFYIAGIPGFALAVIIALFPDPPRGSSGGAGHSHRHSAGFRDYLQLLKNRSLLLIILAQTFSVVILIPLLHFGKQFLIDRLQQSEPDPLRAEKDATQVMLVIMVAGALGIVLSGLIGDRLARRFKGAYALLAGTGYLAGWLAFLVGFRADDFWVFLPALGLGGFCLFLCMPAVNTQIANVVHPSQRAAAWALAVLILHLCGDTLAPPIFGDVLEQVGRQRAFEVFSCALGLASLCCFLAARTAAADIARFVEAAHESPRDHS